MINLYRPIRAVLGMLSLTLTVFCGARAEADPAMWVIKDADSTVYLLGTIHVLKPGTDWRSEKLDAALKSSSEYWMEADIVQDVAVAQTYALNFGTDTRHPLAEKIGEANYAKLVALLERLKIPNTQLPQTRPWLATLALMRAQVMSDGYDPALGVDQTLENEAMAEGKPVKAFETASEQLGFFAHMPEIEASEMLIQTMNELDQGGQLVDEMATAWLAGDVKALQKLANERMRKEAPLLYDLILVQRNTRWVKQIDTMLKGSGTQFIAVGTAHLIGPDSVPEKLRKLGYKIERY